MQCGRGGTQIYCNYYWGEKRGKKKELLGLLIRLEFICRIQNTQIRRNTAWLYTEKKSKHKLLHVKVHHLRFGITQASIKHAYTQAQIHTSYTRHNFKTYTHWTLMAFSYHYRTYFYAVALQSALFEPLGSNFKYPCMSTYYIPIILQVSGVKWDWMHPF